MQILTLNIYLHGINHILSQAPVIYKREYGENSKELFTCKRWFVPCLRPNLLSHPQIYNREKTLVPVGARL